MIKLPGITILTNEEYDNELGMQDVYKRLATTRGEEVMKLEELYERLQGEFNNVDQRYLQLVAAFVDYKSVVHGLLQQ